MKFTLMKERDLQHSIIEYLRLKNYLVVKFNSAGIYRKSTDSYIPQPQRGISDLLFWGMRDVHAHNKSGSPDMSTGLRPTSHQFARGVHIYGAIEVKVGKNKPTQAQLDFGTQMEKAGGIFILAYSLDAVMDVL